MRKKPEENAEPNLTWEGGDLPRIPPGNYQAICIGWQGPTWVQMFRKWKLRLEFRLLAEDVCVSAFYNMGENKNKVRIGRRSSFYAAWTLVNGEIPQKRQKMTLETFRDPSLLYWVRVADATKDKDRAAKPDALIYSKVVKILSVDRK